MILSIKTKLSKFTGLVVKKNWYQDCCIEIWDFNC